jgi:hypothetical protein
MRDEFVVYGNPLGESLAWFRSGIIHAAESSMARFVVIAASYEFAPPESSDAYGV